MNGQRPARKVFREGSLRWDPETGALLSSDEEIVQAVTGRTPAPPASSLPSFSPHANNALGLYGPRRVDCIAGKLVVIGCGEVLPIDTRAEGEALIRELEPKEADLLFEPGCSAAAGAFSSPPEAPGHAAPHTDRLSRRDAATVQGLQEDRGEDARSGMDLGREASLFEGVLA